MDESNDIPAGSRQWNEREVFLQALALSQSDREAFLEANCPDQTSRARIESLLHHHETAPDKLFAFDVKSSESPQEKRTQIDEFKIIHRLGEGGMGDVYLAEDMILGRRVALKLLAGHLVGSERALGRFRDEARNTAALTHPAIVPVFKFGQAGDDWYLVTEFVDGPTLALVIAEQRAQFQSMSTQDVREWHRRAATIGVTIAEALDCAHRAGIVHRDVKPSNILIDRERGPRLADFGIAKSIADEGHAQTSIIGSCHYMSPEQAGIASSQVDQRSDIFSLGVVFYEMLALRRPFDGLTPPHVLRAIIESTPDRLRLIDRRIPLDLETICQKAIEKQPPDRYPTAAHIAADLRCFLSGEPILARPPTKLCLLGRKLKRHRVAVVAAAVTAIFLVAIGAVWFGVVQRRSRMCVAHVVGREAGVQLQVYRVVGSALLAVEKGRNWTMPRDLQLPPGLYRLKAVASNRAFSEASVFLATGAEPPTVVMPATRLAAGDDGMVRFDGGDILSRVASSRGGGQQTVHVMPFFIDVAEVSNIEYRRFAQVTGHPEPSHWVQLGYPAGCDHRPVVGITWEDANAFCRYAGKRLPTAAEWEFAMRWPDSRRLPWKDAAPEGLPQPSADAMERMSLSDLASNRKEYEAHTHDVRSLPALQSAAGLYHGATNVSEFTETVIGGITSQVVIKGASWTDLTEYHDLEEARTYPLKTEDKDGTQRGAWSMEIGCRCARSAQP